MTFRQTLSKATRKGYLNAYLGFETNLIQYFLSKQVHKAYAFVSNKKGKYYKLFNNMWYFGGAGMLSAAFTAPIQVVKTRIQAQSGSIGGQSMLGETQEVIKSISQDLGISGFYRGLGSYVVMNASSSMLRLALYQYAKALFGANQKESWFH